MKNLFVFIFFIFGAFLLLSQEVEARFVSKLQSTVSGNKVIIEWKNPIGFDHKIILYRSNTIINNQDSLTLAPPIKELTDREERFVDSPESGTYYYAALIVNKETNKEDIIFVTFRNYTSSPVVVEKIKSIKITSIKTESNKTSVSVLWSDVSPDKVDNKKISLYRNITPILDDEQLKDSIKIASLDLSSKMFIDFPLSNINYYYAIFLEDDSNKEYLPDINITTKPVFVEMQSKIISDFDVENFIPLPLITLQNDPETGEKMNDTFILKSPVKIEYSQKTSEIVEENRMKNIEIYNGYMKEKNLNIEKLPFKFLKNEEEFEPTEFKIEYNRAMLLIREKDYLKAKITLEDMLSETLPDILMRRVCYYTGMIYYYLSDYNKSYIFFIVSFGTFRKEILPYINSIHYQLYEKIER